MKDLIRFDKADQGRLYGSFWMNFRKTSKRMSKTGNIENELQEQEKKLCAVEITFLFPKYCNGAGEPK